jgi:hypothetical protein
MAKKSIQPGTLLTGQLENNVDGEMLLLNVRDKTLKLWTESNNYKSDFNNVVLASLSFAP